MRTLVACAALLMTGTLAMAQSAVVGRIEVNVVNVDVTVTSHGQPVRGLTRDDFEILEDGVLQPLSNFFPVESAASMAATRPGSILPPPAGDGPTQMDERFRRKVLVVIDNVHTTTIKPCAGEAREVRQRALHLGRIRLVHRRGGPAASGRPPSDLE